MREKFCRLFVFYTALMSSLLLNVQVYEIFYCVKITFLCLILYSSWKREPEETKGLEFKTILVVITESSKVVSGLGECLEQDILFEVPLQTPINLSLVCLNTFCKSLFNWDSHFNGPKLLKVNQKKILIFNRNNGNVVMVHFA